jgi:hypothetical protein
MAKGALGGVKGPGLQRISDYIRVNPSGEKDAAV